MSFAPLHVHTEYSNTHLTDATTRIPSLVDKAIEYGFAGLALTDHECISGAVQFLSYVKDKRKENPDLKFKALLGNEICLCDEAEMIPNTKRYNIPSGHYYHFILLALDAEGFYQIRELSSRAWDRMYSQGNQERLPTFKSDVTEIIGSNPGHVIGSTACLGGQLPKAILAQDGDTASKFLQWCVNTFGEGNFFLEIQPGQSDDQKLVNTKLAGISERYNLPMIVTTDVHYLLAKDRKTHEAFLKSHEEDREAGDFYADTYLMTVEEMKSKLSYLRQDVVNQALQNTVHIIDRVADGEDYAVFHDTIVPRLSLGEFTITGTLDVDPEKYPYIHTYYQSQDKQDLWLMKQCEEGFVSHKLPMNEDYLGKLNYELEQMWAISLKFHQPVSSYYTLTQRLIEICFEAGSLVGVGRGSDGGWLVAYLLNITQLDPITHGNLPSWRHLHQSRPDWPDCDWDSEARRHEAIMDAVRAEFGADRVLATLTFRTETTKSAIQTACRGLGIDSDLAGEMSALVPITRGKVWTLDECLHGNADNGFQPIKELVNKISQYDGLLETIQSIEGLISGRGQHASAVYIFNEPYVKHNSLMRTPKGTPITAFSMNATNETGGLKEDFLTTTTQDMLGTCLELMIADGVIEKKATLRETYNAVLHPDVLDYDTPEMWDLAIEGKIPALFQMSSDMGEKILKKIRPHNVRDLALCNSVMRLVANEDMDPIERLASFKDHHEFWYKEMEEQGLTEDETHTLEKYLLETHGVSAEQETMMMLVQDPKIANFSMTEANKLRKGVSKKNKKLIDQCKALYEQRGRELGVRPAFSEYVWKMYIKPQLG